MIRHAVAALCWFWQSPSVKECIESPTKQATPRSVSEVMFACHLHDGTVEEGARIDICWPLAEGFILPPWIIPKAVHVERWIVEEHCAAAVC